MVSDPRTPLTPDAIAERIEFIRGYAETVERDAPWVDMLDDLLAALTAKDEEAIENAKEKSGLRNIVAVRTHERDSARQQVAELAAALANVVERITTRDRLNTKRAIENARAILARHEAP